VPDTERPARGAVSAKNEEGDVRRWLGGKKFSKNSTRVSGSDGRVSGWPKRKRRSEEKACETGGGVLQKSVVTVGFAFAAEDAAKAAAKSRAKHRRNTRPGGPLHEPRPDIAKIP